MTIFTYIACRNMRQRLADRIHAVVTIHTIADNVVVVEIGRHETNCRMTIFAGVTAEYVIGIFTQCDCIVVTAHARAQHLEVIHFEYRRERNYCMTIFADIRCQRVVSRLAY